MMRKLLYSFLFFISSKFLSKKACAPSLGLLCVAMFFVFSFANAATYYTFTNGTPTNLNLWWSNTNGTGTHPSNFNNAADIFIIQSGDTMTTSANWTVVGTVTVANGGSLVVSNTTSIGAFNIDNGGSASMQQNLTVTGATNITGTISFGSTNGTTRTMTFTGAVTLNSGAVWNETTAGSAASFSFGNNFTNNATTFTAQSQTHAFIGSNRTLNGNTTTVIPTVSMTGSYTNNISSLTISTALSGTNGTLTNPSGSTFTIGGSSSITNFNNAGTANINGNGAISTPAANFVNTGTLNLNGSGAITGITNNAGGTVNLANSGTIGNFNNATATSQLNISDLTVPTISTLTTTVAGNTVNYNGAGNQTIKTNTYSNLILSGSGLKTFGGATTATNLWSIATGVQAALGSSVHSAGILTLGGAGPLTSSWGSTSSNPSATNTNDTFFATGNTGRINITQTPPGSAIDNNYASYSVAGGNSGDIAGFSGEYGNPPLNTTPGSVTLTAPAGTVFINVKFASYGSPGGTSPNFTIGSCHAFNSRAVTTTLLGNTTATIPTSGKTFNEVFGDPCYGIVKSYNVVATYSTPICAGTNPGTITGSTPTGGNGGYSYLWEVSTTSATGGYSVAPGVSDAINYDIPNAISVPTWYRRTVTSGIYSDATIVVIPVNIPGQLSAPTSASVTPSSVCAGTAVTLTVTGGTSGTNKGGYAEWTSGTCDGPVVGRSTLLDGSITITPTADTRYFVKYKNACGETTCNTNVVTVTNPTSITLTSATSTVTTCSPSVVLPLSLSYSATKGTPTTYSIVWSTAANTAGFSNKTDTAFTATTGNGAGTISNAFSIPANVAAGTYTGTLTVKTGSCVSFGNPISVTINPRPKATISGTTTICSGASTPISVALTGTAPWTISYTDGTNSSTFSTSSNPYTINVSPTSSRTYSITGLSDATTCSAVAGDLSGSAIITVNNAPLITTQPSSSTACSGTNTSFSVVATGAGLTYKWQVSTNGGASFTNLSDGGIYSNTSSATMNITGVTAGMNNYRYKIVITGTCSPALTSDAVTLTVNTKPSITAQPSGSIICSGNNTSFGVTASGDGLTYKWQVSTNGGANFSDLSDGGIYSNTSTATLNITGATVGMNNYQYHVVINGACTPAVTSNAGTLTVNPTPTVANAGVDQYGNGVFTLAANTATAGTGTWSIASGPNTSLTQFSNVNAANATFTPIGAGTYTLNWTIATSSCGLTTDQVVISNCVGNLIKNGDFNDDTNYWSKANTKGSYVEVLRENVYFPNGNSENYTAELDSQASLGQTVTVVPNVPYTLSFIYARRPGSSPTVAVDVKIIDGSNTITRSYTTNDTTNASMFQSIQFTPSSSSVWIEFYNSLETTTLGSIVDNIVLLPTSQVNPVATTAPKGKFKTLDACNGTSVQLDVENVPASGVTYSWTTTSTGVTFSQTNIKNPKITVTGTGIKNATVVVTTTGGCSSVSSTTYVNVLALPVATLVSNDADNTFCEGTSVTFTASGGTSYAFKVGSTTVQSGTTDNYTTTTLTDGQIVTVDVTNSSGCTSTSAGITNTVIPNNTITLTSATGTDSQTVCANAAITNITYSISGATGVDFGTLPAGISGIWSGNVATISGTPTVNSTSSYNYTVTLTGGCGTITATGTINVDSTPVGGSIAGSASVCSGTGDTVLTLSGNSGTIAYWESSLDNFATAGTVINNTTTTLTASNLTATTSYRAVITNGVCASVNSAVATITVKPLPTAPTITKNNNVACGGFGSITLTDLPGDWTINQTGLTTGSRSFPGTDSSIAIQNLTIDTYSFTVTNNTTGCTSSAAVVDITDIGSVTEWTDSGWSNGEPDGSKSVVITSVAVDQPFKSDKPNVVACSLTINVPTNGPDVEIPSNVTLTITNAVKSNGKLVFKSGSSLLQTTNVENEGDIVYIRETKVRRMDLTYWSMPVTSTKQGGFTMNDFSPTTLYDKYLYWSSDFKWATNLFGTDPMVVGRGYSIRAPQEFDTQIAETFEGKFVGVPNNGDIDVTGPAVDRYFFLGNPYPSAIDVAKLWEANPDVLGPLYFWIHSALPQKAPGDNTYRYSSNDYVIYSATGSVDVSGGADPKTFQGFIAAGQGFFAKPKTTVIHFNNQMREGATSNGDFFKVAKSSSIERNRVWLNIKNNEGAFKQLLVGYIQGATNGFDFNYDAATLGANTSVDFYSINEAKKLTIQGRALPFDDTDIVPLGYKAVNEGDFTISIDHADGFFDQQEVYLEDKSTGKTINLRNENYTFSTLAGTFADRFVLRYTNKTLGTGDFENIEDSVLISVKNKVVSITSSKETIKDVNIFNVGAQLMYSKNKVNSSELQINNLHSSDQVLLVKVTLENGSTVSKKVIFSNLP